MLLGLPQGIKMSALAKVILECEGNFKRHGPAELGDIEMEGPDA